MMAAGVRSNTSRTASSMRCSATVALPNVCTYNDTGSATPMA